MPDLKLPGARTGLVYIWAIMLGPILLFVAGVALLTMGFWRDVESVAAIGAIGIVASLVLPRMQGAVEIGPGGIKGNLDSDIALGVIQTALESGAPAEQAIELAADAEQAIWSWNLASEATGPPPSSSARHVRPVDVLHLSRRLVSQWSTEFVAGALGLDQECAAIVERVAREKGWQVGRHVRVGTGRASIESLTSSSRQKKARSSSSLCMCGASMFSPT